MLLLALPDSLLVKILNLVSEDAQETSHWSVVSTKFCELSDHHFVDFQRHGTIMIRPRLQGRVPYRVANNHTVVALQRLSNHELESGILSSNYHFVKIFDLLKFPRLNQERNIYTTKMQLKFGEFQLCCYNLVLKIDLSQPFQYPYLRAGEMHRFDPFNAGNIDTLLDEQNLPLAGTLLTTVFPRLTIINLSATKWTQHVIKSINWTILETLI